MSTFKPPSRLTAIIAVALVACAQPNALPDDGFVTVHGARVAYDVFGSGTAAPALVIHGGPGSSSCIYPPTLSQLAETRPVVVYDQVGSGYSSRIAPEDLPAFTDLARFVEEIEALRAELGLEELHLVGHSWGGSVAMEYLLNGNVEGVLSVTFVGPLLSTEDWIADANQLVTTLSEESQRAIAAAREAGDYSTPEFQAANTEFLSQYGTRSTPSEEFLSACALQPPGNSGLYEYMWGPSEFLSTGTLRDYDRTAQLPDLDLPTLFLVGEFDEATPERMEEYQALVPGSEVRVLPDAGHVSNFDRPELFNEALIEFLASVEGR